MKLDDAGYWRKRAKRHTKRAIKDGARYVATVNPDAYKPLVDRAWLMPGMREGGHYTFEITLLARWDVVLAKDTRKSIKDSIRAKLAKTAKTS